MILITLFLHYRSFLSHTLRLSNIATKINIFAENPFFKFSRTCRILLTQLIFADGYNQPKDATNHYEWKVHRIIDGS